MEARRRASAPLADNATAWRERWGERLDTAWEDGRADQLGAELLRALGRGARATALGAAAVAVGVAVGLPLLRPAYAATPSKPDSTVRAQSRVAFWNPSHLRFACELGTTFQ